MRTVHTQVFSQGTDVDTARRPPLRIGVRSVLMPFLVHFGILRADYYLSMAALLGTCPLSGRQCSPLRRFPALQARVLSVCSTAGSSSHLLLGATPIRQRLGLGEAYPAAHPPVSLKTPCPSSASRSSSLLPRALGAIGLCVDGVRARLPPSVLCGYPRS